SPTGLEEIIAQAIRDSGVTAVSQGTAEDRYVDLAVWSDDLSPWVGNPLPIEVRLTVKGKADVNAAVGHLTQALAGVHMPWGLLLYLRAEIDVVKAVTVPNILCVPAEQFLESLRETSFGDLIRRLRN